VTGAVVTDVAEALEELEREFPGAVMHEPDDVGGAYVTVGGIRLGRGWTREEAPLTFHLPYNYPAASPYPYYLPDDVTPVADWPLALQRVRWRGRGMIQVSLRHNNWDPECDRVVGCVLQVAARLQSTCA
jgi:hypothetical protein